MEIRLTNDELERQRLKRALARKRATSGSRVERGASIRIRPRRWERRGYGPQLPAA